MSTESVVRPLSAHTRRTLIIAEAGVNHNGNLETALALVDAASEAGADVVKFQTFSARTLAVAATPKATYQALAGDPGESAYEMLGRLELTRDMHVALIERCIQHGIEFMSTGFDPASVDMLIGLGQSRLKVPSGEITNLPLLRYIGATRLPVILSTGMATLSEVGAAVEALVDSGSLREELVVLQCTTAYPTPDGEVNLNAMITMRHQFDLATGFSDHTLGIHCAVAAVALGAGAIEKHLTLDRHDAGPDHFASLEPDEFGRLVASIRGVELALGNGVKEPQRSEVGNIVAARRSIRASNELPNGIRIQAKDLVALRPGDGRSPMDWDEVLGTTTGRAYASGELID